MYDLQDLQMTPQKAQAACQSLHERMGTRKVPRVLTVSHDFGNSKPVTGCLSCFMEDGFHSPGCPKETEILMRQKQEDVPSDSEPLPTDPSRNDYTPSGKIH